MINTALHTHTASFMLFHLPRLKLLNFSVVVGWLLKKLILCCVWLKLHNNCLSFQSTSTFMHSYLPLCILTYVYTCRSNPSAIKDEKRRKNEKKAEKKKLYYISLIYHMIELKAGWLSISLPEK